MIVLAVSRPPNLPAARPYSGRPKADSLQAGGDPGGTPPHSRQGSPEVSPDNSHYLSDYAVKMPYWTAGNSAREPFAEWKNGHTLAWYQAYNTSKHDRAQELRAATFAAVIDAFCGLSAVITTQFLFHDFGPANGVLTDQGIGDGYEEGTGQYVRLKYPSSLPSADRYDFKWADLKTVSDPFRKFDYDAV